MNKLALLGLICASGSTVITANAQEQNESKSIERISVVGSATNFQINAIDMENYQANDLADIFRLSPSVSVGGSVGIAQKIYVRGLEDYMLNVTVDGAQQTSTLFHHIGRVTLDPDLLQQIDIQAGAGEATSGPGAIGGSIRFKTKDASDLLVDDENFGGRVKANYFTNEGRRISGTAYGKLGSDWGAIGYYSDVSRENMTDGNGDEIYGSSADQSLLFLKTSGNISDKQYLSLSLEQRDEEGAFSARPNWIVQADDPLYASEAERSTYTANYHLSYSPLVNLQLTAYQTSSSFRGGRFDWLAEIDTFGFDIRNTSDFEGHSFVYGADYRSDEVNSGSADSQDSEGHKEEGSVFGFYFQGYTDLTPNLIVSYGVRFDDYSYEQKILLDEYYGTTITDEPATTESTSVSINTGLAYSLNKNWTLGLSYAEAARGKQIGDGFTIDSYLWDGSDQSVASSNLNPETVANVEASIEYNSTNLNAKVALFSATIDDVIYEGSEEAPVYDNIGSVTTEGFEFDVTYSWGDVDFYMGFSNVDTELDPVSGYYSVDYDSIALNAYEFGGLGSSRGDTWVLGAEYTLNSETQFGINITKVSGITIETLHQSLENGWVDELYDLNKPGYTTVDLFANWQATENLVVNATITNLFDKFYIDQSSVGDYSGVPGYGIVVGPAEAGRDIRLSVSYTF